MGFVDFLFNYLEKMYCTGCNKNKRHEYFLTDANEYSDRDLTYQFCTKCRFDMKNGKVPKGLR